MTERVHRGERLRGRPLRYLLTMLLIERGPLTVAGLAGALEQEGFVLKGRPSKTISDALRCEIAHGRVIRLGRGRYGPGTMPRQTRRWIEQRVERLHAHRCAAAAMVEAPNPIGQRHSDNGDGETRLSL